ncbi:MAG: hypothetical protein R2734_03070 [Nocardioides sp.]
MPVESSPESGQALKQVHSIGRRRAWMIWLVGLSVYVLAVFHRSSLGVAGLLAADRFGVDAARLSFFTVLQPCTPACRSRSASCSTASATADAPGRGWR